MRIISPGKTSWEISPSLIRIFGLDQSEAPIISVIGAGGKTSIVEYLAREYEVLKKKAIVTTTTKMVQPRNWTWCREESVEAVDNYLHFHTVLWIGLPGEEGKMISHGELFLKQLALKGLPMLIEADGARNLPFKLPGKKEPVIIKNTNIVIAVLGMTALNKCWRDVCFRYELAYEYLQKKEDKLITEEDYAKVIMSSFGLKKGVTENMEYIVVLNQIDNETLKYQALSIRKILKNDGLEKVYLTSFLP